MHFAATGAVHLEGSAASGARQQTELPNVSVVPAVASSTPAAAAVDLPTDGEVPTLSLPKSASAGAAPPNVQV